MRTSHLAVYAAITGVIFGVISAEPLSLVLYRLREPYFKSPIRAGYGKLIVRNDAMGEGAFGTKRSNGRTHTGLDIMAPIGTPVYASKSGMAFRGMVPTGYGKYIMIYHPDGSQTFYGHLSEWTVVSTQRVAQGEIVGFTGNTGNAKNRAIQPHLHFEIRKGGEPVDPQDIIR
jgi:murein DD-endopeptidase MepM/ murein hydrolase activator NlpD